MLIGLFAGLTAFSVLELLGRAGLGTFLVLSILQGAAAGLVFGFFFGFTDAVFYKELRSGALKAVTAAVVGAAVASSAHLLSAQGLLMSSNMLRQPDGSISILIPLWRSFGWMLMGTAIGTIDGIYRRTIRRVIAGALGGLAGGLVGGLCYELIIRYIPGASYSGLIGLVMMGMLTGLFIGEFERRFSYGRLRVLNGKLKDREFFLIKQRTIVGCGLKDDVYLHGYSSIPEGRFLREGRDVYFETEKQTQSSSTAGSDATLLNDRPAGPRQNLKYQDTIRLGSVKLLYLPM